MATASSIAEANYVKEEVAQKWVDNHKETYKEFHKWAYEQGNIATILGYAYGPFEPFSPCRFVAEENAKGSGESPARSAVNHCIQGTAAIETKLAVNKVRQALKGTNSVIVGVIHDVRRD
jgi:DNA polymerase I-like protein with 3'-5' exonuclease and polymerase domains